MNDAGNGGGGGGGAGMGARGRRGGAGGGAGRPKQQFWTKEGTEGLGQKLGECLMELSMLKEEHVNLRKEKMDAAKVRGRGGREVDLTVSRVSGARKGADFTPISIRVAAALHIQLYRHTDRGGECVA